MNDNLSAYLQHGTPGGPYLTQKVPARVDLLWWQVEGLSYTATGYGGRIPTRYKVQYNGRWRRVYCAIWSNAGTCYIGESIRDGVIVSDVGLAQ
jgi:hypothetical protein